MSKLLEKELVKDFLSHRNAFPINCSISAAFHKHLLQLPWAGFHLDWASLSHQSFNLAERPECQLEKWLLTSALRNDSFIAIVESTSTQAVAIRKELLTRNFDTLIGTLPGPQWGFGISGDATSFYCHFKHYLEYDGVETLYVSGDDIVR